MEMQRCSQMLATIVGDDPSRILELKVGKEGWKRGWEGGASHVFCGKGTAKASASAAAIIVKGNRRALWLLSLSLSIAHSAAAVCVAREMPKNGIRTVKICASADKISYWTVERVDC